MTAPLSTEQMEILIRPEHIAFYDSLRDILPLKVRKKLTSLHTRAGQILHDPDSTGFSPPPPSREETTRLFGEVYAHLVKHVHILPLRRIMAEMDIPPPPVLSRDQNHTLVMNTEFFHHIELYLDAETAEKLRDALIVASFTFEGKKLSTDHQLLGMDAVVLTIDAVKLLLGEIYETLKFPGDQRELKRIMKALEIDLPVSIGRGGRG